MIALETVVKKGRFMSVIRTLKSCWRNVTTFVAGTLLLVSCTDHPGAMAQSTPDKGKKIQGELISATPAPAMAAAPTTAMAAPASAARKNGDYMAIGFDKLSNYKFEMPDETAGPSTNPVAPSAERIPAPVRALDKKPVALSGFMLPLRVADGAVTEMLIMKDQSMCCYGNIPRINDWVSVKMKGKGVKPIMDQPVTLFGKLHVGEIRENGYLVGIYEMDGENMIGPEE